MSNKESKSPFLIINELKKSWADKKITLRELAAILIVVNERLISLASSMDIDDLAKKEFVLDGITKAFYVLWPLIPMPAFVKPFWYLITPLAKSIFISVADSMTEYIYHKIIKPTHVTPVEEKKEV